MVSCVSALHLNVTNSASCLLSLFLSKFLNVMSKCCGSSLVGLILVVFLSHDLLLCQTYSYSSNIVQSDPWQVRVKKESK